MRRTVPFRPAFSMIEVLVVLGLIALLLGLLMPVLHRIRGAADRTRDMNNQKQLALACHNFHDVFRKLPFNGVKGSVADPKKNDSGSWLYQILPFIEQQALFNNPGAAENVVIPILLTPGRSRKGTVSRGKVKGPQSDYALNTWLNEPTKGALDAPNRNASLIVITDGTSNTLLLGQLALRTTDYSKTDEAEGRESILVGGTMGTGRNQARHVNDGPDIDFANRFGGPFQGITIFAMGDGSVRSVATSVNIGPALTPSGGEAVTLD